MEGERKLANLHVEGKDLHRHDILVHHAARWLLQGHLVVRDGLTVLPKSLQAVAAEEEAPDGLGAGEQNGL